MPELNPEYAQFEKELDAMVQEISQRLKKANFTDVELAQLSAQIDFLEELRNLGFEDLVDKYFNNYDDVLERILKEAKGRGVDFANVSIENLVLVKELDKEYLLRSAASWSSRYESELMRSVIRGDNIKQTIQNLQGIPLTDAQLGTVLNTSYSDFSRTSTREIYKDKPEQRFRYEGGILPTSSEECRWLMQNQDPKGYTAKEIEKGIETPFVHKYDDKLGTFKKGDKKVINWQGRNPNFNCIHTFIPVED